MGATGSHQATVGFRPRLAGPAHGGTVPDVAWTLHGTGLAVNRI